MDYTLINMKQTAYVAVVVKFDGSSKLYTYKANSSECIVPGDRVIVYTNGQHKIVDVIEVHEDPLSHLDPNIDYRWITQRIDDSERIERESNQAEMIKMLKTFQAKRRVLEAAKAQEEILIASGITQDEIKNLDILGTKVKVIHVK